MAEQFDPYHVWLGIPKGEQPASHYRLLGLALFESDPKVIETAADRQMGHIRTFQTGNPDMSTEILNELSAAKICLLKPETKSEYDRNLASRMTAAAPAVPTPAAGVPTSSVSVREGPASGRGTTGGTTREGAKKQVRRPKPPSSKTKGGPAEIAKIVAGGFGGILIALVILWWGFRNDPFGFVAWLHQQTATEPIAETKPTERQPETKPAEAKAQTKPAKSKARSAEPGATSDEPPLLASSPGDGSTAKAKQPVPPGTPPTDNSIQGAPGAVVTVVRMKPVPIDKSPYPDLVGGTSFTWKEKPTTKIENGVAEFTVHEPGMVYLVADWSVMGSGGGWQKECHTKEQLISEGWECLGPGKFIENDVRLVFRKVCDKGDYRIRTNKYWPPGVQLPPRQDSTAVGKSPTGDGPLKLAEDDFVGEWRIFGDGKLSSIFTLLANHTATKSHAPKVTGEWQFAGNEARIEWSDGWRDVLRVEPTRVRKLAFKPGAIWDKDEPTNEQSAVKSE